MDKIDFVELAKYCQESFKNEHNTQNDKYVGTIFVAIFSDTVLTSRTPHILKNAEKCILIHEYTQLAVTNFYSWYTVEIIDQNGCVLKDRIDDEFELKTFAAGGFANQRMELSARGKTFYSCGTPFESNIKTMLKLYSRIKDIKSMKERMLVADLFCKDNTILELEKQVEDFKFSNKLLECERNQYQHLLEEIKKMVFDK